MAMTRADSAAASSDSSLTQQHDWLSDVETPGKQAQSVSAANISQGAEELPTAQQGLQQGPQQGPQHGRHWEPQHGPQQGPQHGPKHAPQPEPQDGPQQGPQQDCAGAQQQEAKVLQAEAVSGERHSC